MEGASRNGFPRWIWRSEASAKLRVPSPLKILLFVFFFNVHRMVMVFLGATISLSELVGTGFPWVPGMEISNEFLCMF